MKVKDYVEVAKKTDGLPAGKQMNEINPRFGLAGEIGYLLTALKKEVRDNAPTADATKATIKDELGDITWYAATIARRAGLDFQADVLLGNLVRVQTHYSDSNLAPAPLLKNVLKPGGQVSKAIARGTSAVATFGRYQELAVKTSKYKERSALVPYLVQAWHNAGDLLAPFGATEKGAENSLLESGEDVAKSLGDIMWYVAGFAHVYELNLDEIMAANAKKIVSAFPAHDQKIPTPLYDDGFGPLEQFPRKFCVDFVPLDDQTTAMLINGIRIGDPLTDNAYEIDGYRFHDSVHWAFVAILGWSPVMRGLLKRKRKLNQKIDAVEDGARAQIVEEMIVKIAHSHAVGFGKKKLLDNRKHINLNLLKDIVQLAEGLEVAGGRDGVEACKYWEWQNAILEGFKIYNKLRRAFEKDRESRGRIEVDLMNRSVKYKNLSKKQGTAVPY